MKACDTKVNSMVRTWKDERGVGLIITVIIAGVLFGFLALTFDLGRIYIAHNELQTFTDAAALAAIPELDGTQEGIERARDVAENYPNRWTFGSQEVSNPEVYFAQDADGPWLENPTSPDDYRFVRVSASGPVPLYFLPVLSGLLGSGSVSGGSTFAASTAGPLALAAPGVGNSFDVRADSGAGQLRKTVFQQGLLPYSPHAHLDPGREPVTNPGYSQQDPFNFEVGRQYTMRWPPPGHRSNDLSGRCEGDIYDPDAGELVFDPPVENDERGFINIGEPLYQWAGSNGSAFIRQAIVSNTQSHGIVIGDPIVNVSGQRQTEDAALRERIGQDTDPYSRTYAEYMANADANGNIVGNGRRIVFMPVQNAWDEDRVIDFATFFLPPADEVCCPLGTGLCSSAGAGTNSAPKPCCAEYVGSGVLYGFRKAATGDVAVYVPRLTE